MLWEKARKFARQKHEGMLRNDGRTPYIEHPEKVVDFLILLGIKDDDVLAAAYLHDVVEDCDVTVEEICEEFNDNIADMVYQLTRNVPREEYNARFTDPNICDAVKLIKLADTAHNCRTLEEIKPENAARKVRECEEIFLPLAEKLSPKLYQEISDSIRRYRLILEHNKKINSR